MSHLRLRSVSPERHTRRATVRRLSDGADWFTFSSNNGLVVPVILPSTECLTRKSFRTVPSDGSLSLSLVQRPKPSVTALWHTSYIQARTSSDALPLHIMHVVHVRLFPCFSLRLTAALSLSASQRPVYNFMPRASVEADRLCFSFPLLL